jgi:hypothetical protein
MFKMQDWEPDETSYLGNTPAYLWIVPARVQGTWRLALEGGSTFSVDLEQTFQKLGGTVELGRVRGGLREARLRGDALSFAFVDGEGVVHELDGRAAGGGLEGTFRAGTRKGRWTARRAEPRPLAGLQVSRVRIR